MSRKNKNVLKFESELTEPVEFSIFVTLRKTKTADNPPYKPIYLLKYIALNVQFKIDSIFENYRTWLFTHHNFKTQKNRRRLY